ncbi:MAG: hypothetical protein HY078_12410 [Elusimicrobia bacterium]|nr:hypothetical protein [Elusimicrobiota bacterium]
MSFVLSSDGTWVDGLLAAAAAGVLAWTWWTARGQPRPLFWLRSGAIILVGVCALGLTLQRLQTRSVKPRLAILLDTGLTMGASDGTGKTRLARAAEWLLKHREEISARAEPALYAGTDRARRIGWDDLKTLSPATAGFDFEGAARDVADDGAAGRLWLFSDGNAAGGGDAAAVWKAPIDALGIGPKRTAKAVYLTDLQTPDFVFLHARFSVAARFEASNLAGSAVAARLWKGATLVSENRVPIKGEYEVAMTTFAAFAQSLGQERYRIELVPESGGAVKASREFGVEVIRQKHRIMYLAGRPSFEYSHLRDLLKSNPNFELVSFVILRNPENVSPVPDNELSLIPFPAQEIFVQNLMHFDMFILENFAYWRFNLPVMYLEGLKRFVSNGGALLVIGGSNAFTQGGYRGTPLEEVLPVTLWNSADDYVPGLLKPKASNITNPLILQADTPEESAALWDGLPLLDGYNRFSSVKPGSTVLLAHPTEKLAGGQPSPLLTIREYGKGKVMVLGSDSTWRWKLGGGQNWRAVSFYARFWAKAVQYLSGTLDLKKVKFAPLPERMPSREPATLTLHLFDDSFKPLSGAEAELRVLWTPPDGKARSVTPHEKERGVFEIELTGLAEGVHTVRAVGRHRGLAWGEDQAKFRWDAKPPEEPLQREWLSRIATRASGRYSDLDRADAGSLIAALPPVRTQGEVMRRWHVWTWTGWLWVLLALFGAEWYLRRRWGYV